jgi:hypothetical protein
MTTDITQYDYPIEYNILKRGFLLVAGVGIGVTVLVPNLYMMFTKARYTNKFSMIYLFPSIMFGLGGLYGVCTKSSYSLVPGSILQLVAFWFY